MFIATDETGILGTLTLAMFRIPTGIRAWIEDVIVDDAARGKGVGRLLNEAAIAHAFDEGAITVDLTSRPSARPPTGCTSASASCSARPTSTATASPSSSRAEPQQRR